MLGAVIIPSALAISDTHNDTITAIYGGGNPNGGWESNSDNGIKLALRGKAYSNGNTPSDGAGNYIFPTGAAPNNANRAFWNYEFSIDSGASVLTGYDYYFGIDIDPSQGVNYLFGLVDPLTAYGDNSYGTSSTLNGQGVEGTAALLAGSNFIAQNSQNIQFLGLDKNLNATYNYELFAVAKGHGSSGARLASVDISVTVGSGGAAVPDAGSSVVLLSLGALALGAFRMRAKAA